MKKMIAFLLALFLAFSACTFAASAGKPDNPGKPESIPPINTDNDPSPEVILPPTDQTDNTPASDNAPCFIGDDGPLVDPPADWIPCV